MPRKKSVAPEPNEQELMEQAAEAVESAVAEGPTENAAPSALWLKDLPRTPLPARRH